MELTVKLESFEGPLDLLLHLLEKNKVNIYDIPIVEITNQYMEYIHEMERPIIYTKSPINITFTGLFSIIFYFISLYHKIKSHPEPALPVQPSQIRQCLHQPHNRLPCHTS